MSPSIIFSFISLISSSLTLIVTFISIIILLIRLRHSHDVVLLLLTNTYFTIFMFSIVAIVLFVKVLRADLYGFVPLTDTQLAACRLEGFLMFLSFGLCYMSFILQAFYRLLRVIHAKRKFFQTFGFNLALVIVTWLVFTLILLPSHFWPTGPIYVLFPADYYCGIPYSHVAGLLFTTIIIYFSPVAYLSLMYARLIYFIRHHRFTPTQTRQKLKVQRDVLVIRRIIFIVNALTMNGLPNTVFTIMTIVNPTISGSYYMYRVQWSIPCVGISVLSMALVMITPQLKNLMKHRLFIRGTRVAPTGHSTRDREVRDDASITQTRF